MFKRGVLSLLLIALFLTSCNRDPKAAAKSYLESGNKYFKAGKYKQARLMYIKALSKDKLLGEAYYKEAITEQELGNYIAAVRGFHRAVELQEDNIDAYARLANLYLAAYIGNPKHDPQFLNEMQALSDKLLKKDKKSYDGLRIRAFINLAHQDLKAGIADLEAANAVKPMQADVIVALVQALGADNRFDESEKLARQFIAANKTAPAMYDVLYMAYISRNRIADGEGILKEKIANNPKSLDNRLQLAAHYYAARDRAKVDQTLNDILSHAGDFPDSRERVGDFYFRIRDFQLALDQYQLGVKENPKRKLDYQKKMVEALFAQNKKVEANQIVEAMLKDSPKDSEALAMRAAMLLQTGGSDNVAKAVVEMQGLVSRLPENFVLRYNLGRALLTKGDVDQAQIQFQEAVKIRPDYLLARLALAEITFNKREFAKTVSMCDEILQFDTHNPIAHLIRARSQYAIGERVKAREELTTLVKEYPNLNDAHYQLALLDLNEKDFKSADAAFEKIFKESGDSRALMGLADSYMAQKRAPEAIKLLQTELVKSPSRADYRIALGNIGVRSADLELAIAQFKKVTEQYPNSGDAYLRLGEVYRYKHDLNNATWAFKKANENLPNDFRPPLQLGLMFDGSGDKKSARDYYEQVLKIQPDQEIALNNLAFMLAEQGGDLDKALGFAQRAKQRMPDHTDVSDTLGWIYLKKNLSDSAVNIFQDIVKKQPDNPIYRYHLALALLQKGDKVQAKREAAAALAQKPSKEDEQKLRDLISKIG